MATIFAICLKLTDPVSIIPSETSEEPDLYVNGVAEATNAAVSIYVVFSPFVASSKFLFNLIYHV